ncbi:MAG: phenylalanine--tRNA ligase subunit beta, partial [Limisphaerales bacterium]
MGGQNSEINANTTDVLIESACFKPQNIRATSKKLELRTDSSYRFERGCDVEICDWASRRAAQLICDLASGQVLGSSIDAYENPAKPKEITLRHEKVGALLNVEISAEQQNKMLQQLGLELLPSTPDSQFSNSFRIPSFRVDLKREIDLIEEITRLYGIEKIPATAPRGATGSNAFDKVHDEISEARRILTGLGLNEAQGQTLVSSDEGRVSSAEIVALQNPLSSDMDVLRPSLLPGLLNILRHNLTRKNNNVGLFEIGRVFTKTNEEILEERRTAIALTGQRNSLFWSGSERDAKVDVYDLKGILEEFFEQFGLRGLTFTRRENSTEIFLESATILLGKNRLGEIGQLLPTLAKKYDLRDAVFLAETNFDLLLARRNPSKSFKPLPAFPTIRRDVAMLVT